MGRPKIDSRLAKKWEAFDYTGSALLVARMCTETGVHHLLEPAETAELIFFQLGIDL